MDFVNPLLLFGASAAVVPIVLHLILRQRPRPLEFPALRLIQQRRHANTRRLRVRHWLLLLLRMAALALLAFALARPSLNASGLGADQELPVSAVLVFDTAPRMAYRHENQTRLEAAQALGKWLLTQLPGQSQVAVLESSLSSAVFQVDAGAAGDRIERLTTVTADRPLAEVLSEAARLLREAEHPRKEIYIFSDLTRRSWPQESSTLLAERLEPLVDLGVYLIDVGVAEPKNASLGDVVPSAQSLAESSQLGISTDVASLGVRGVKTIELWMDDAQGEPVKRSQETVELEPGSVAAVEFPPLTLERGTRQGTVRIVGEDGLAADDQRFFTVAVQPAWKVLLVGNPPAERSVRLLDEALAPRAMRRAGRARFDCQVASYDELLGELGEPWGAVLLVDPPPLDLEIWQALSEYAARGGGVAVFLGPSAEPIERFAEPPVQELLPAPLAQQARFPDGDVFLQPQQLDHPVLARFRPLAEGVPWDTLPVFRYWQLGPLAEGCRVVVPYSNGEAALIERPVGTGRVLTLTTPATPRPGEAPWNLLPTGLDAWPYLVLVNELTLYLCGAGDANFNYRPGQQVLIRTPGRSLPATFVLMPPGGPSERRGADPKENAIAISSTSAVGNYRLRAGGGDDAWEAGFSVNLAPESTDLTRVDPAELAPLFGKVPLHIAHNREEIRRDVTLGRVGRELYPWMIVLVALVLAGEQLMANWFYRGEPAPTGAPGGAPLATSRAASP